MFGLSGPICDAPIIADGLHLVGSINLVGFRLHGHQQSSCASSAIVEILVLGRASAILGDDLTSDVAGSI